MVDSRLRNKKNTAGYKMVNFGGGVIIVIYTSDNTYLIHIRQYVIFQYIE